MPLLALTARSLAWAQQDSTEVHLRRGAAPWRAHHWAACDLLAAQQTAGGRGPAGQNRLAMMARPPAGAPLTNMPARLARLYCSSSF